MQLKHALRIRKINGEMVNNGGREYSAENRMSGRKAPTEIDRSGISAGPEGEVTHYQIKGDRRLTG